MNPGRYRIACSWTDDQGAGWSHTLGPYPDRRDAYDAFHRETHRRHHGIARPPSSGCHNLVISLLDGEGATAQTLERWPDGLRTERPAATEGAPA